MSGKAIILYIEDNAANMRLVERILFVRNDIKLFCADTASLGLELAAAHRPELILLDINLPEMDGYAVMERLRSNDETRQIPVVAITADAMPADIEHSKDVGFAAHITKPLDINRLMQTLDELLE